METRLSELRLKPWLLMELNQRGYETAVDMAHLSSEECLRIPGMGGRDWRKVAKAMGREPYDPHPR
ncbi:MULTISPECIES: hypothetical protein [unclassified Rhizobium]|uniref:hypothetical protein n=1 Tax=unclassified Rhizobium TaxID=2613769 RepID=UPI0009EC463F|nr:MULTISPECIES: hypothetical protein [unclassified Rhizobium]